MRVLLKAVKHFKVLARASAIFMDFSEAVPGDGGLEPSGSFACPLFPSSATVCK